MDNDPTVVNNQMVVPIEDCGVSCQFEWLEVSSNFFAVSVYTPALILGFVAYGVWLIVKKKRGK